MIKRFNANKARLRRHQRVRKRVHGTPARPRLCVFRSAGHIYAQIVDDEHGHTLVAASSLESSKSEPTKSSGKAASATKAAPKSRASAKAAPETKAEAPAGKGAKGGKGAGAAAQTPAPEPTEAAEEETAVGLKGIADNHKVAQALSVGRLIAERAREQGITQVVFDRGGYIYHGRVAALAAGAREGGLDF